MGHSQSILITGGTGVIGQELVKAFVDKGYQTYFTSRSAENIESLERDIQGAKGIIFDFSSEEKAVEAFIKTLDDQGVGDVHHVVHGYRDTQNYKLGTDGLPSQTQWMSEYRDAVIVPYHLTVALADRGLQSALLISSIYGSSAANMTLYDGDQSKAPVHYNISKAAQNHAAKELAVRLAPRNIRVNAIAYGGVKGRAPDDFVQKYDDLCPYKGMIEPQNVAHSAVFLCSAGAEHITGQVLGVDGGWGVW